MSGWKGGRSASAWAPGFLGRRARTESSFRNINPPSDTHTANKILTNTILNVDKHNIPKGKIHHNCKLLPEDIRTKINTRNNIRKHNPLDPNLAQLNNEITSDIQHHKTALWKSHLDGNWDHRKKNTPYGKL